MSQNNQYFDMDSYQSGMNGNGRRSGDGGAFWGGLAVGIMGTLLILCVIVLILWVTGNGNLSIGKSDVVNEEETATSVKGSGFVSDDMVKKINKLVKTIREKYFLEEVSDEELESGIYKGLMASLGDPYSEYYTSQEYMDLMQGSEGVYYGIGAYVSMDEVTNLPKISGVFKDSPAERAGLRTNDLLYMIGGEQTYGLSLSEAVSRIKGEENTKVDITVVRDGEQVELTAIRGKVETPTVETEMLDNGMGYLRITEFDDVTTNQYLSGIKELRDAGMKGLILDLRSNPGGNLSTVVAIAQNILPKGIIVYTEDKEGNRKDYNCKGDKELDVPLVVLVDMNSASASEILAGAIQDYGKGTLVGTTTFGKGIVQSVIPSKDGSAIKITVSGYFTPKGRNIHKVGIEPDVVCEFDGSLYYDVENPIDTQLEKAKEILAEKMR